MIGTTGPEQWVCKHTDVHSQTEELRSLPKQASAAGKGDFVKLVKGNCCVEVLLVDNLWWRKVWPFQ
jgi:hypothetical protein